MKEQKWESCGSISSNELVPFEGQTDTQEKNLEDILVALKKQLDEIWTLPEDEQKRAIRRLYLKWHPDKNPNDPDFAENVFKFLKSEINKHKSGEFHLEDLDEMASRHKRNFYREKRYYSRENYSYPTGSQRGSSRSESRASGYMSDSETESVQLLHTPHMLNTNTSLHFSSPVTVSSRSKQRLGHKVT